MSLSDQFNPPNPKMLAEDERIFAALSQITAYKPANSNYAADKIAAALAEFIRARDAMTAAEAALLTANDHATAAGWALHNLILEAKTQVRAQFGADSVEIQGLGLKCASKRKWPGGVRPRSEQNENWHANLLRDQERLCSR